MHFQPAVVVDVSQLAEAIHEEVHTRPRGTDHLRKDFLTDPGNHRVGFDLRAEIREKQKDTGEPFLAGVEKLIDQVLLDARVAVEKESQEEISQALVLVEHSGHLLLRDAHEHCCRHRGCGCQPYNLGSSDTLLSNEVARMEQPGLLPCRVARGR